MAPKRNRQDSQPGQAKRSRQQSIHLPEELEDELASWWEANRCLYDKSHHSFFNTQMKTEIYQKKLREIKESAQWGNLEMVKELTEDRLKKVSNIFYSLYFIHLQLKNCQLYLEIATFR